MKCRKGLTVGVLPGKTAGGKKSRVIQLGEAGCILSKQRKIIDVLQSNMQIGIVCFFQFAVFYARIAYSQDCYAENFYCVAAIIYTQQFIKYIAEKRDAKRNICPIFQLYRRIRTALMRFFHRHIFEVNNMPNRAAGDRDSSPIIVPASCTFLDGIFVLVFSVCINYSVFGTFH